MATWNAAQLYPALCSAGEYRTGKRISMRRVIGYIASHYRKDKIWMRRTRPDKRRYQVGAAASTSAGRDLPCKDTPPVGFGHHSRLSWWPWQPTHW